MTVRISKTSPKLSMALLTIFLSIFLLTSPSLAQLDPTFGTNGTVTGGASTSRSLGHFLLPGGKIFVVSRTEDGTSRVCFSRFNSNGTPDGTYGTNGFIDVAVPFTSQISGRINAAARQSDGKIVLVGLDDGDTGIIARYNENATIDTTFAGGGVHRPDIGQFSGDDGLNSVLIQPDGKLLAAGFAQADGTFYPKLSLIRYLSNGTLDPSLNGIGYIIHSPVVLPFEDGSEIFALQSTGKIIVGNRYETGTGGTYPSRTSIRRFNTDGTIDNTFSALTFPYHNIIGTLRCAFVQPDDKILVGTQTVTNDVLEIVHNDADVARYNPNGDIDSGFGTSGHAVIDVAKWMPDRPLGFQVLADGQIVVAVLTTVSGSRGPLSGGYLSYSRLSSTGQINGKFLAVNARTDERDRIQTSIASDGKILTVLRTSAGADVLLVRVVGVPLETYILQSLPYSFSSAAAGVPAKPSLFRPSDGSWRVYLNSGIAGFGGPDDIPVVADYIGSITPDVAFFRPSNGTWYIARQDSSNVTDPLTVRWGLAGDVPAPADYDGDGKSDIAVFRPSNGVWYIRNSSDGSYRFVQWGLNGDKPAVGDFDGDQKYDIAVFRPSDGNWYIIKSSDGGFIFTHFGLDGDIPVQEDYDNDDKFDIAVYRPSTGVWYRILSSDGSFLANQWGLPGDVPVPAEYDRDGKMNVAVWRPSNGYWYILNPDFTSMHFYVWGNPTDIPLPGKF